MHIQKPYSTSWRTSLLAALLVIVSAHASAQWHWMDNRGRPVFSDTPPPPDISDRQIKKRPAPRSVLAAQPAGTAADVVPEVRSSPVDTAFEASKQQAEAAEQARQTADAQRVARARADNCGRAQRGKAALDSGMRIASVNAQGEPEMLDDKSRVDESRRLEEIIRSDCAKLPN